MLSCWMLVKILFAISGPVSVYIDQKTSGQPVRRNHQVAGRSIIQRCYLFQVLLAPQQLLKYRGIRRGGHQNQREFAVPQYGGRVFAIGVQSETAYIRLG